MLNDGPILALGAHPDDLELGCGATLAKLSKLGVSITALIMTQGGRGTVDHDARGIETERSLRHIGVQSIAQHDFPDTLLHEHLNAMIAVIEEAVNRIRPVRVYTMFHADRHQDHRAVYDASAVACRSVPQILSYETPSSYPHFVPTLFERIDDFLEVKVEALKMHLSQGERLYMQEEKVRAAAHFRGVQVNLGPSEGFIPYKLVL